MTDKRKKPGKVPVRSLVIIGVLFGAYLVALFYASERDGPAWLLKMLEICGFVWVLGIPIGIIVSGVVSGFVGEIKLLRQNRSWVKEHGKPKRMFCVDCPHCRWSYYHPFYYGKFRHAFVSKAPQYCRKFGLELSGQGTQRCAVRNNALAMYEEKDKP